MSETEEIYYDYLAEEWEGTGRMQGGGGKKKKKSGTTTVGRQRIGGSQAWSTTEQLCPKGCMKKCCSKKSKRTPSV